MQNRTRHVQCGSAKKLSPRIRKIKRIKEANELYTAEEIHVGFRAKAVKLVEGELSMMAVRHAFLNEPQGLLSGQCTDGKLLRFSANSMDSSPQFINREHTKRVSVRSSLNFYRLNDLFHILAGIAKSRRW